MKNKKLSIIIPNYNTKKITLECINSIYSNKIDYSYEVIVVDNGSTDGSAEEFKKIEGIKLIKNKDNLGFSKACNIGIRASTGEYVLLLNSDTRVTKDSINKMLKYAQGNNKIGAIAPKLVNPDGSLQESVFHFPTIVSAIKEYWLGKKNSYAKYAPKGNRPTRVDIAVMTAFLITPVGLKKAGLLDEKYFMYFEDFDYCRKLYKNNLDVIYIPTATVAHHHGASGTKLASSHNQWRRLIPSSKIYHGIVIHTLINTIIWLSQKLKR